MLAAKKKRMEEGLKQERDGISENMYSNATFKQFSEIDKKVKADGPKTEAVGKAAFEGSSTPVKKGDEDNTAKALGHQMREVSAGKDMKSIFGAAVKEDLEAKKKELEQIEKERSEREQEAKRKGIF